MHRKPDRVWELTAVALRISDNLPAFNGISSTGRLLEVPPVIHSEGDELNAVTRPSARSSKGGSFSPAEARICSSRQMRFDTPCWKVCQTPALSPTNSSAW